MAENDFHSDDAFQRSVRDQILVPQFYETRCNGRFVMLDKGRFSTMLQRRFAVDTVVQSRDGSAVAIEEKIVRWPGYPYQSYCLETDSCTVPGRESKGWMHYAEADYLFYCFQQEDGGLLADLIEFQALKVWFWQRAETFKTFQMTTRNRTAGRLVPIHAVRDAVPVSRLRFDPPGTERGFRQVGSAAAATVDRALGMAAARGHQ